MIIVTTLLTLLPMGPVATSQDDDTRVVLYDVSDLVKPDRQGDLTAVFRPGVPDAEEQRSLKPGQSEELDALVRVLRRHIQPPLSKGQWTTQGGPPNVFGVGGSSTQHAWIAEFLAEQRREDGTIYTVEMRTVKLSPGDPKELGLAELPVVLDEKGASDLLRRLQERDDVDLLVAPTVSVFNRQRAAISTLKETAYVSRWERREHVHPDGRTILDPVIETVREGIIIECLITRVGGGLLDVDLHVELADISSMPTLETEYGTISVPLVLTRDLRTSLALTSGVTAVFAGLGTDDETMLLLVRVSATAPEPLEENGAPGEDGKRRAR